MHYEKFEAIGERGEACHVLMHAVPQPSGQVSSVYTLATGERLKATDQADEFATLDGRRKFRLRSPRAAQR
jgi:hypothetical protein